MLERLDALDAVEQVHPTIVINTGRRRIDFQPAYPFATFDYRILCEILARRLTDIEVAVAPFDGRDDDGDRRVRAPVLIDASGWRAVLARTYGAPPPDPVHRSVGMELRHGHGGYGVTGRYYAVTRTAVREFQQMVHDRYDSSMVVDGIVGTVTWHWLDELDPGLSRHHADAFAPRHWVGDRCARMPAPHARLAGRGPRGGRLLSPLML